MITATSPRLDPAIIRQKLSLSQEKLSSLLKVSSKTVNRAEKQHLPLKDADAQARLAKLDEIVTLGLMVYTLDGLKEFLITPLPVFDLPQATLRERYTALDLMQIGDFDRVISALAADFEGLGF
jgi:DNA-binding XRE family transcriptional regulator